jgi:hypothetical protein
MIDRTKEKLYTFTQLARRCPGCKEGKSMDPSTVWRMANEGSEGVRLEYEVIGSTAFSSLEAMSRYSAGVREAREARRSGRTPRTGARTPAKRRRASEAAKAKLIAKGA